MNELQALIQGKIAPTSMNLQNVIQWAEQYQDPTCDEYKLLELATNLILASYLEQAEKYI